MRRTRLVRRHLSTRRSQNPPTSARGMSAAHPTKCTILPRTNTQRRRATTVPRTHSNAPQDLARRWLSWLLSRLGSYHLRIPPYMGHLLYRLRQLQIRSCESQLDSVGGFSESYRVGDDGGCCVNGVHVTAVGGQNAVHAAIGQGYQRQTVPSHGRRFRSDL